MKWSNETTITVYTNPDRTPKDIKARCKGIFAIHDDLDEPETKTLTHIPSGMSLISKSGTHSLYRAVKQLSSLDWTGVEDGEKIPETFDIEKFRSIQRLFG